MAQARAWQELLPESETVTTSSSDAVGEFIAMFDRQLNKDSLTNRISRHFSGQPDPVEAGRAVPAEAERVPATDRSQGMGGGGLREARSAEDQAKYDLAMMLYPYVGEKYDPPQIRHAVHSGDALPFNNLFKENN